MFILINNKNLRSGFVLICKVMTQVQLLHLVIYLLIFHNFFFQRSSNALVFRIFGDSDQNNFKKIWHGITHNQCM